MSRKVQCMSNTKVEESYISWTQPKCQSKWSHAWMYVMYIVRFHLKRLIQHVASVPEMPNFAATNLPNHKQLNSRRDCPPWLRGFPQLPISRLSETDKTPPAAGSQLSGARWSPCFVVDLAVFHAVLDPALGTPDISRPGPIWQCLPSNEWLCSVYFQSSIKIWLCNIFSRENRRVSGSWIFQNCISASKMESTTKPGCPVWCHTNRPIHILGHTDTSSPTFISWVLHIEHHESSL